MVHLPTRSVNFYAALFIGPVAVHDNSRRAWRGPVFSIPGTISVDNIHVRWDKSRHSKWLLFFGKREAFHHDIDVFSPFLHNRRNHLDAKNSRSAAAIRVGGRSGECGFRILPRSMMS